MASLGTNTLGVEVFSGLQGEETSSLTHMVGDSVGASAGAMEPILARFCLMAKLCFGPPVSDNISKDNGIPKTMPSLVPLVQLSLLGFNLDGTQSNGNWAVSPWYA